jgi:branched-chain amino acid transport system permease protein
VTGRGVTLSAGLAAVALLAAGVPMIGSSYVTGIGFSLFMWIALAQSWIILSGMAGYISLGHVVFAGIGAYVMVLGFNVVPLWLAVPVAALAAGGFAAIIGYPVLRVRGPYFVILTFGVAEFVRYGVINIESALGTFSRLLLGAPSIDALYWMMAALAAIATSTAYVVRRSRLGRGLIAIREDEAAAETIGVPVARYKIYGFVLSAAIPGAVGAVLILRTGYFEASQAFDPVVSFTVVTMAIIGGSDDARGPILGAAFLLLISELLWASLPQLYMIILGALLVIFVVAAPNGMVGLLGAITGRQR